MRKGIIIAAGVVLVSAWFVVPRVRAGPDGKRPTAWLLRPLTVPIGRSRLDVAYVEDWGLGETSGATYAMRVGEDPGTLICGPRGVYIVLEFGSANALRDAHI
jgi:hypothetical protein